MATAASSKTFLQPGSTINKQAQLSNAYQELGRELGSDTIKVVGGYTLGRVIGEGTFGSVQLATHRLTGTRCAIKKIPKASSAHLTREIHHHRRLHHPNIVQLYEILATETHIWLVSELCSGGELFDYLVERGRLLEGEARRMFGELTVAVGYLHRQGVVHRDLKLENVLLDGELRIKLGDLGFAREWQRGRLMETFCGTTGYASPEMLACRKYLGPETDIWSLGVILYILLCGGLPFDDDDERVMKELISKGEYEEPEWLSEEARSLIRGMLQQDPTQRLTIEQILTHPWFQMTIVDNLTQGETHSVPGTPSASTSENQPFFHDAFNKNDPGPSSSRHHHHSNLPSPLGQNFPSTEPDKISEASESSYDFVESNKSKGDAAATIPTTTEDESDKPVPRVHSGEFSQTEKTLELLHPNSSQTTLRRPHSESSDSIRTKVAQKSTLEEHSEVDEEGEDSFTRDDHSIHLAPAVHSRTPSRTKRRSISSTLTVERRLSHHSSTGNWQTHSPENYLTQLEKERTALFSRPSEKYLLDQMSALGFDAGQLKHSVSCDACDSAAAMWWILRAKQVERGETDEAIEASQASAARRRERAAAYAREERRRAREKAKDKDKEGEATGRRGSAPERSDASNVQSDAEKTTEVKFMETPGKMPKTPAFELGMPILTTTAPPTQTGTPVEARPLSATEPFAPPHLPAQHPLRLDTAAVPQTPPKDIHRTEVLASPSDSSPRERLKGRSPSMSMLQRATSALTGKKPEDKVEEGGDSKGEGRTSPTKLSKAMPKSKMPRSESEGALLGVGRGSPASSMTITSPVATPRNELRDTSAPIELTAIDLSQEVNQADQSKGKGGKRDSFWSSVRYMFHDERRRRKREMGTSPLSVVDNKIRIAPTVVLSRGAAARSPHVNRVPQPSSRRGSLDVRPGLNSRRSSSIASQLSSINSANDVRDGLAALGRHQSQASHRSHGSQTPNSDREFGSALEFSSRPGSAMSVRRGSSRRSSASVNVRSPSIHSETSRRSTGPASPLHNYQRRPPSGSASTRVRHFKVIPETQILRSGSVASSVRSNASSRASSVERGREDMDSDHDDASYRSRRRRDDDRRILAIAQQINRTRSPLSMSETQSNSGFRINDSKPKAPKRDVFQRKDDEWVDEDELPAFEGGLGQGASASAQQWEAPKSTGAARAAAFPSSTPHTSKRKQQHKSKRGNGRDERGGMAGVAEEDESEERGRQMDTVSGSGHNGRRNGIPERSGKPAIVMEEVEEEEEE